MLEGLEKQIPVLREKAEILEEIKIDSNLRKDLEDIRNRIRNAEEVIFAKKTLVELFRSDNANSLLMENQTYDISSRLKEYDQLLSFYLKITNSMQSIYETCTKENIGPIRQNLLLAKIRKHLHSLEKKKIPAESTLMEIEDTLDSLCKDTGKDAVDLLENALQSKRQLNEKLKKLVEIEDEGRSLDSTAEDISALMSFVANYGSASLNETNPSATNFKKLTDKLLGDFEK